MGHDPFAPHTDGRQPGYMPEVLEVVVPGDDELETMERADLADLADRLGLSTSGKAPTLRKRLAEYRDRDADGDGRDDQGHDVAESPAVGD